MGLFNDMLAKKIRVDGHTVSVPNETTPDAIIAAVGKDPNTTSLVTLRPNDTVQYLPSNKPIYLRDGQKLETSMTGQGG